jgi:hypothetical protein
MQPQRIVRPLNATAKDQLLDALFRRAVRFQKAQAIRQVNAESRGTAGQAGSSCDQSGVPSTAANLSTCDPT